MFVRLLIFLAALTGGAGLSQFPEFSQQYEQRLAGAVDEMQVVVQNFDTTLADLGQTRADAFAPGQDLSDREARMLGNAKGNIDRLAFLEDALAKVRNAPVLSRLFAAPVVADTQIAKRAYGDFKPAIPLTVEGIACAALGFVAAWVLVGLLFWVITYPFRRRDEDDDDEQEARYA